MESVQPRADAATRYGPLPATTAVQSAGNARREAAVQPGNAANPSSNAGETTATFSRRAQELSARQTSDAMQARQAAETDAAAEANRRATAQSTATEVAGALGAQARRAYQGVDSMSAAG